jgi:hypothetical protein
VGDVVGDREADRAVEVEIASESAVEAEIELEVALWFGAGYLGFSDAGDSPSRCIKLKADC